MGIRWHSELLQDLSYTGRVVRATPSFALAVIVIQGIAIGASVTIFSFVQGVLLAPLPFPEADRIVVIRTVHSGQGVDDAASGPDFEDWRREAQSFESMAAYRWANLDFTDGNQNKRYQGLCVTHGFFNVIGIEPHLGRSFVESDEVDRGERLVLSEQVWRERFEAAPEIVGRTADVYSWAAWPKTGIRSWPVLGVVGQEVCFPPTTAGLRAESVLVDQSIAFWRPLVFDQYDKREYRNQTNVIARLKSGVTVEQARADMKLVSQRLEEEHPATNRGWQAEVIPIHDVVTQQIRPALVLLSGAVACVLLIACANTGSLILVRSISRQPELAIRLAHGAGRLRVVRQLVTEAVVFCLVSGVLGLLLSVWGTDIIRALAPSDVPRLREVSIDRNVLLFALGLSVLSGVAVSLIPALLACRTSLSEVLKSGGRTGSASRSRRWVMNSLVVGETALCLMLLAGAATLIQGFIRVTGRDPGFRQDHLLTMLVSLPQAKYEWNHNSIFCNRLVERIETLPEVEAAAAIRGMPMQENLIDVSIFVPGEPHYEPADQPRVRGRVVTPGYFRTMQIPLLEGREFTVEDGIGEIGDAGVSVISESTAKRFWPGQSPVGQRFHVVSLEYPDIEVIGVVADVRYSGMVEPVTNDIYYHEALFPQAEFTLLIRTQVPPAQLGGAVQELVHDEEPEAVITDVMTMGEAVSQSLSHERFTMVLLTAFSLCALLLAVTGHYGVVSYAVSQRRRELGIRLAIGAAPGDLVRLIVREGALLSVVGLVAGIAGSFGIARLLHSSIPGFDAVDLPTVAMATVLLLASACIATLLPAWRTTRVQPSEVLRCE